MAAETTPKITCIQDLMSSFQESLRQRQAEYDALPEEEKQRLRDEENRKEELRKQEELLSSYKAKGIPPKFYASEWENWVCDTDDKLKAFNIVKGMAWKTNLFLCGKSGTGKTHLAMCLTKDGAKYRRLPDIFREVRTDFNSEQETIDYYGTIKLLIIDEIGRQKFSSFEYNLFFEIIDKRWNHEVPTTLITNQTEKEFLAEYGTAIIDRLRPVIVDFNWESRRESLNLDIPSPKEDDIDF